MKSEPAGQHYDRVHELWLQVMGQEFHFCGSERDLEIEGNDGIDIAESTSRLTDVMINSIPVKVRSGFTIVDVGCGTGFQTNLLSQMFNATVIGVSPSKIAIENATICYSSSQTSFICDEILKCQFDDGSIDLFWLLESSHLIREKEELFNFCHKKLISKGGLVLCDLFVDETYHGIDRAILRSIRRAFGPLDVRSMDYYELGLRRSGFELKAVRDLSSMVIDTPSIWRSRAQSISAAASEEVAYMIQACRHLEDAFASGTLKYGLISAVKV